MNEEISREELEKDETPKKIKREKSIKIRLTEEEHQKLMELKDGIELATWIRTTCLNIENLEQGNQRKAKPPIKQADPQVLKELNRIGVNMNQIAKAINHYGYDLVSQLKINQGLAQISEQMDEVIRKL